MNEKSTSIEVKFTHLPVINYAMQQNKVALIRLFTLENKSTEILRKIKINLSVDPDFATSTNYFIDTISVGETLRIESLDLNLSSSYFAQLTEKMQGSIKLEITGEDVILFEKTYPIEVLAFDEWGGLSILPEMLSSFVTPNHPALIPIVQRASEILNKWTGSPSFDSYQSANPERVWNQMAAVYTAISELNIVYSSVPPSFEEYGQRVRLVDAVLAHKMGNCLDLSLLYAACLEQIGLYPFIILSQGHAFTGAWLVSETFPDSIVDDASLFTKRIASGMNEIALIEATVMCAGSGADFMAATKLANNELSKPNAFILGIDVKRSRFAGIRPLPQRILNGQQWEIAENQSTTKTENVIPEKISRYDLSNIDQNIEVTKKLLWERKLLDLSLRNNLLNLSIRRSSLQLISVDLDKIEDALFDGAEFQILARPTDWDHPLYDAKIQNNKLKDTDPIIDLIRSELDQKRLRSYLSDVELNKTLQTLYKASRLSIEENGANTLYLALGLMKWYESPTSEQARYAPILLLPVDIIRKSAAKGYVIRTREEETILNITLLEMLRQNFGITISGLDPLPSDGKGIDVKLIYTIIRNSIKNQKKWDVTEQAILGIFSFSKFIMWNDIHNNSDKLLQNEIVSSLINGKIEWSVDSAMANASDLEKNLAPTDIILPISADSSQIEAVYEAINEKSFILHGPPGTGKSQTITNIIANALYKGKRVLFVAEKMAALSVVQSRLAAMGLAPFCLELHSNKSKKSGVLAQLRVTSEVTKQKSPESFGHEADRLKNLRSEISTYIDTLHNTYPFGLSLYDAITRYLAIEENIEFRFSQSVFGNLSNVKIQEFDDAVEILIGVGRAYGHPHQHPLEKIRIADYSSQKKTEIEDLLLEHISLLNKLESSIDLLNQLFGDSVTGGANKEQLQQQVTIALKLITIPELTPALLTRPRLTEVLDQYKEISKRGLKRDNLKEAISKQFRDGIFSINAKQLLSEWNENEGKWFLGKYFGQKPIKKQLKAESVNNNLDDEKIVEYLNLLISYNEECTYLNQYNGELYLLFGRYGKTGAENWKIISQIVADVEILNGLILDYATDIAQSAQIKESLSRQLSEGIDSFKGVYGGSFAEIEKLLSELALSDNLLSETIGTTQTDLYTHSSEWIKEARVQLKDWLANMDKLRDWYQWLAVVERFEKLGIPFVTDEYKTNNLPTERFLNIYNKSFYRACIQYMLAENSEMELFNGDLFNETILKYKRLIAEFEDLTRKELQSRLASNIPDFTLEAAQNSEVGILQKNIRNNGRGLSLRRLFDQIPTLLHRMCPCMLMSPISVAQYIDPDAEKFDLIIFDEASQMPTYEAVGAIARGKNVIVVGDPKQMPPTSFFTTNSTDEDNLEIEDLESILDDCLALSMPSKYLLWHYRSKHESLIAFSNSEYYDNKLLTFPSPDNIESKVKLIKVGGFYDKGKSRQNQIEAEAIVEEVKRRLSDNKLQQKSIGIVTFSVVQQALIEDLLSDLFVLRPDLEIIANDREEPLFIKNLENVQGDERDVILFSVGYGPNAEGKVSMNFGPLNRVGGERRLNVAVSRARYEMIIFSTLSSDQIDLNRTSSVGVSGLKRFLEYAERGERMVLDTQANSLSNKGVEYLIAKELSDRGYAIHTHIGASGYKIDIGIVDKENPSNYLLGIICDGETYKDTKTVRDREIVQPGVLKLLGWNILRVWTMDWWDNKDKVVDNILCAIEEASSNKNNPPQEDDDIKAATIKVKQTDLLQTSHVVTEIKHAPTEQPLVLDSYKQAQLTAVNLVTDAFLYAENEALIKRQIKQVIETEAPISKSLICKKILSAWGIARLGQRIDAHFEKLFESLSFYQVKHDDISFFWLDEQHYTSYSSYRTNVERDAIDLPPEEVANAMHELLKQQISLPLKDFTRIVGQHFGFARGGTFVDASMQRGLKVALDKGYLKVENDRAIIL